MRVRYRGPFSLEGITAWECDLSGCAPLESASVQPAHVEALFLPGGTTAGNPLQGANRLRRAGGTASGLGCGGTPPFLPRRRLLSRDICPDGQGRLPGPARTGAHPVGGGCLPHGPSGRPAAQPQRLYGGPRAGLGAVRPRVPVPAPKRAAGRLFPAQALGTPVPSVQPAAGSG